jgi:hypothetical protein
MTGTGLSAAAQIERVRPVSAFLASESPLPVMRAIPRL